jgi:hypothetical protein
MTSIPQEEQCLQVRQAFLDSTVQNVKEDVQRYTTKLAFNLDEVGMSDCDDRKKTNIVVQATMRGQMIRHGTSRNGKDIMAIASVSTTGKSLIAYMIMLQDFASGREQPKKHVVGLGTDLVLKSNLKPHINTDIF